MTRTSNSSLDLQSSDNTHRATSRTASPGTAATPIGPASPPMESQATEGRAPSLARRSFFLFASGLALAACGGGGGGGGGAGPVQPPPTGGGGGDGGAPGDPGDPAPRETQIAGFSASASEVFVAESVTLKGTFSGGTGRIDPIPGEVVSGQSVVSARLDRDQTFRLVVQGPRSQIERALTVRVGFRDRYFEIPRHFDGVGHAAVAAADGSVLLIGGARASVDDADRIERYQPETHFLGTAGRLLQPRIHPVATRRTDGSILVTGGALPSENAAEAELIDEKTAGSKPAGRMSVVRSGHAAAPIGGGRILIAGGITLGEGSAIGVSASAEIWEPATRSFRRLESPMGTPRAFHTMTLLGDGRVLIAGGHTTAESPHLAEIFDPVTERFTPVLSSFPMRAFHAALAAPDGSVLLLGGETRHAPSQDADPTASVLRYDRTNNLIQQLPPLSVARSAGQAVMLPSGSALVFGGRSFDGASMVQAERYDPAVGGVRIAALPYASLGHSATRLNDGRVLVAGGVSPWGPFPSGLALYG